MRTVLAGLATFAVGLLSISSARGDLTIHKRSRVETGTGYTVKDATESWQPGQTAIIVCDMWDSHHCLNAVRRCVEMAPRMNDVLEKAREPCVLIIHPPSSCMDAHQDHPGRKLAQSAPKSSDLPTDISQWCRVIPSESKGDYPIDHEQGGEDDELEEHK